MSEPIRVAVLLGGKSAEHEVSLQSAKNVIEAIDRTRYEVVPVGIDKQGAWFLCDPSSYLFHEDDPKRIQLNVSSAEQLAIVPGKPRHPLIRLRDGASIGPIDAVFPVLHGPMGEDGTVQGLLKMAEVAFVGAGVLGSAVGMDKVVMKRLLMDAGIPVARYCTAAWHEREGLDFNAIRDRLGLPLFVKPANLGSSVGVNKADDRQGFERAVQDAFRFDVRILIEECIQGRELECSVLGNEHPKASLPGEILPRHAFYSYEAKYIDEDGAGLVIPAELPIESVERIQALSIEAFKALGCEGMARVDGFLREDSEVVINEINTIPGFTRISMYPKLWDATGVPYPELIHQLIQLGMERYEREKALETSYAFA
ncbi:MAG: D-alanine--D-alanine ligase [Desulfobacteraceae bacterium]|jgi:D-alanine-D-alanine ligase